MFLLWLDVAFHRCIYETLSAAFWEVGTSTGVPRRGAESKGGEERLSQVSLRADDSNDGVALFTEFEKQVLG